MHSSSTEYMQGTKVSQSAEHQQIARRKQPNTTGIRLELGDVTRHNLKQLKIVNDHVFPVKYETSFYDQVLKNNPQFAKLAYYNDIVVGAVVCSLETTATSALPWKRTHQRLYIKTLGCLEPYRRAGLGSLMLNHVLEVAKQLPAVDYVYLHVWVENAGAIEFYNRFGFGITCVVENYYAKLNPPDAYVLRRQIRGTPGEYDKSYDK